MAKITTGQMFEQWELMNQKLEALDNKINGIIDGSTPANTQLTGSKVEYPYKRGVFKGDGSLYLDAPEWATHVAVVMIIHGVTGSFENNQGISLNTRVVPDGRSGARTTVRLTGDRYNSVGRIAHFWGVGVNSGDISNISLETKYAPVPPHRHLMIEPYSTGTFEEDEGFDMEILVVWS